MLGACGGAPDAVCVIMRCPRMRPREVFILEDLKDTNIVQFMGACFDEGSAMLVTEFMAGGNLFDAIGNDRSGKLCWYQRWGAPARPAQPASSCHIPMRRMACNAVVHAVARSAASGRFWHVHAASWDQGLVVMAWPGSQEVLTKCYRGEGTESQRGCLLGCRGRKIAMDVARGMDKMHSRHIIHLDLKSPNILLTASGTAKIAARLSWQHAVALAEHLRKGSTLHAHSYNPGLYVYAARLQGPCDAYMP